MSGRNHHEEMPQINGGDHLQNLANDGQNQLKPELYQAGVNLEDVNRRRQSDTATFGLTGLHAVNERTTVAINNIFGNSTEMTANRLRLAVNVFELNKQAPGQFGSDQGAFTPEQFQKMGAHLTLLAENHSNPQAAQAILAVRDKYC